MRKFSLERVASALAYAGISFSREELQLRSEDQSGGNKIGVIVDNLGGRQNNFCAASIQELWKRGSLPFLFEIPDKPDLFSLSSDMTFPFLMRNIVAMELSGLLKENDITGVVALLKHNGGSLASVLGAMLHRAVLLKKRSGEDFYGVIGYWNDEATQQNSIISESKSSISIDCFIAASLGLMPKEGDCFFDSDNEIRGSNLAKILLELFENKKPEYSIAEIVKANLGNVVTSWAALGGAADWLLHIPFVAALAGIELSLYDMSVVSKNTPILCLSDNETGRGTCESLVQALFHRNCIEDVRTIEGRWSKRFDTVDKDILSNVEYILKRPTSGVMLYKGNVCESVIMREVDAANSILDKIKKGLFVVVSFSCKEIEGNSSFSDETILYRLASSANKEDIIGYVSTASVEWQREIPRWRTLELIPLLRELVGIRVLHFLLVIYGDGPLMSGLPIRNKLLIETSSFPLLKPVILTLTDGIWGVNEGGMILASPEALQEGAIGAFETGDWCWIDLQEKRLELVDKHATVNAWKRGEGVVPMLSRIFMAREEFASIISSLKTSRQGFASQIQLELNNIDKKRDGLVPHILLHSGILEPFIIPELKRV